MGLLLLIDSMHATSVHNKGDSDHSSLVKTVDDDQDDTSASLKNRAAEHNNDFSDEYQGIMLGKRRFGSHAIRLPSESILLGKRRLPIESVLLGKRRLPIEAVLLGRRNLPNGGVLLGKRR